MRAIVTRTYGSPEVVQVEEMTKPVPKANEVLIRNYATVLSGAEGAARKGSDVAARLYFGLARPRFPILGTNFSGTVEGIGAGVTRYQVGDDVFGSVGPRMGAHAEYVSVAEDGIIALRPAGISAVDAAAISDGALTALPFLRDEAHLSSGQSILINGASGAVGTAAIQLAKHYGATVTAVCSTANLDLVKSLGADSVIDYTASDFAATEEEFDVVFDAVGKSSFSKCKSLLKPGGIYLTTVPSLAILLQMLWTAKIGSRKAGIAFTGLRKPAAMAADLELLGELAAAGNFAAVIEKSYPIEDAAEAHSRVDTGRKTGSLVITLAGAA
jgi:NADPH:quinone reductase-like Zn-dependent oxidoreductase